MCWCLMHLAILGAHTFVILLKILNSCCWLLKWRMMCQIVPLWDPQESSYVDSCSSYLWVFVMSCAYVPSTCPSVLLLICPHVHWALHLVLYSIYHNSKIPLLKTGYINWLFILQNKGDDILFPIIQNHSSIHEEEGKVTNRSERTL